LVRLAGPLRILVLGCGDPDGGDDALGPEFAESIGRLNLPGVNVEIADALTLEHAQLVWQQEVVIFARAGCGLASPFTFKSLGAAKAATPWAGGRNCDPVWADGPSASKARDRRPRRPVRFNWDSLEPAELLELAARLYGRGPEAYVLTIGGAEVAADGPLSETARANLTKAVEFVEAAIRLRLAA